MLGGSRAEFQGEIEGEHDQDLWNPPMKLQRIQNSLKKRLSPQVCLCPLSLTVELTSTDHKLPIPEGEKETSTASIPSDTGACPAEHSGLTRAIVPTLGENKGCTEGKLKYMSGP